MNSMIELNADQIASISGADATPYDAANSCKAWGAGGELIGAAIGIGLASYYTGSTYAIVVFGVAGSAAGFGIGYGLCKLVKLVGE